MDVPLRVYRLAQWWAHLVGALRVHPHKHWANYPPQEDRGCARGGRPSVDRKRNIPRSDTLTGRRGPALVISGRGLRPTRLAKHDRRVRESPPPTGSSTTPSVVGRRRSTARPLDEREDH